ARYRDPFLPHTRGSTSTCPDRRTAALVSPAYAGIDPAGIQPARAVAGFPRIRGDRPPWESSTCPTSVFPPHTRGSTVPSAPRSQCAPVSPAYAGIDPSSTVRKRAPVRFPRIRGDRPHVDRG